MYLNGTIIIAIGSCNLSISLWHYEFRLGGVHRSGDTHTKLNPQGKQFSQFNENRQDHKVHWGNCIPIPILLYYILLHCLIRHTQSSKLSDDPRCTKFFCYIYLMSKTQHHIPCCNWRFRQVLQFSVLLFTFNIYHMSHKNYCKTVKISRRWTIHVTYTSQKHLQSNTYIKLIFWHLNLILDDLDLYL